MSPSAGDIGVLSDTHGLLRPEVRDRLRGCARILHAGDIGGPAVLAELRASAEVVAVRGNVDTGPWAAELKAEEYVELDGRRTCLVHDLHSLSLDPAAAGFDVVIHGHSHRPTVEWKDGILYLNPGSAGPKRFHLPVSMAVLSLDDEAIVPEIIALPV